LVFLKEKCALKATGIVWAASHFWEHFAAKIVNRKGHYQVLGVLRS
jgi:hypothetical protein